ncbi:MAG: hypothetical protein DYG89_13015 [Caldilinea sp. CFX5]|nr:hypothetical protein [Caldilinea sp. CFX5]
MATVGVSYEYTVTASDPDGPSFGLRFIVIDENIAWLSTEDLGNGNLKLSGVPSIDDIGVHRFKIQVFDAANLPAEKEIEVTVQLNLAGGPGFNNDIDASSTGDQPPADNPTPTETPTATPTATPMETPTATPIVAS